MGIVCVPDVVLTATSESLVFTAPETICLSVRVTTIGCSDENCATASQSMATVPACSVFIVSFLSLTFRIVPVRRSPFLMVTCSADKVMKQQQSMTVKTLVLHILVSSLLLLVFPAQARGLLLEWFGFANPISLEFYAGIGRHENAIARQTKYPSIVNVRRDFRNMQYKTLRYTKVALNATRRSEFERENLESVLLYAGQELRNPIPANREFRIPQE